MNNSSKVKKISITIATIILLIVIAICICVILYSNKMLPKGLHEYLSSIIEKEEEIVSNKEINDEEIPFYEVEYELELPEYKDIEILNLANNETMLFGSFSQRTVDNVSIIKADGKYGLISNQDGKILLEPIYDNFMKDIKTGDKFESDVESIYGIKGEQYDIISLITFKTKKNVNVIGHGGGSYNYYDENKDVIWSQEYNDITEYTKDELTLEKYSELNTKYAFCIGKEEGKLVELSRPLYGYFNSETGKILIKPEFEKASIFQNGVAGVKKDGKAYYISENNVRLSDDYFEDVTGVYNFKSWIKQDGKWKLARFPKLEERAKYYKENNAKKESNIKDNKTNTLENEELTNNTTIDNQRNTTNTSNIINTTNNTNTIKNSQNYRNIVKNESN